jgi:hypothetical protein
MPPDRCLLCLHYSDLRCSGPGTSAHHCLIDRFSSWAPHPEDEGRCKVVKRWDTDEPVFCSLPENHIGACDFYNRVGVARRVYALRRQLEQAKTKLEVYELREKLAAKDKPMSQCRCGHEANDHTEAGCNHCACAVWYITFWGSMKREWPDSYLDRTVRELLAEAGNGSIAFIRPDHVAIVATGEEAERFKRLLEPGPEVKRVGPEQE